MCLGGAEVTACGAAGGACAACQAGQLCESGACVLDPASQWKIRLLDVSVPTTKTTGDAWDGLGGAPDIVVLVSLDGVPFNGLGASPEVSDVFEATLNYTTLRSASAADLQNELYFDVSDADAASDDAIGRCIVRDLAESVILGGATQTLDCPRDVATGNAGFTLRWQVVRP